MFVFLFTAIANLLLFIIPLSMFIYALLFDPVGVGFLPINGIGDWIAVIFLGGLDFCLILLFIFSVFGFFGERENEKLGF